MKDLKSDVKSGKMLADYTYVYNFSLSLCHDTYLAEEMTQEAFLRILKKQKCSPENEYNCAYLCTIAKNYYLDYLKGQKKTVDSNCRIPDNSDVEECVLKRDLALNIYKILHIMREPYKEVFILRVFGELDYNLIANVFSKSESWARVTYHRAKKMILDHIGKDK